VTRLPAEFTIENRAVTVLVPPAAVGNIH
jgi:hypothetical protein